MGIQGSFSGWQCWNLESSPSGVTTQLALLGLLLGHLPRALHPSRAPPLFTGLPTSVLGTLCPFLRALPLSLSSQPRLSLRTGKRTCREQLSFCSPPQTPKTLRKKPHSPGWACLEKKIPRELENHSSIHYLPRGIDWGQPGSARCLNFIL